LRSEAKQGSLKAQEHFSCTIPDWSLAPKHTVHERTRSNKGVIWGQMVNSCFWI